MGYVPTGNKQTDIAHYQKLLIPLNIFVCILCIVSIVTMMFLPFIKIDIGKIASNEEFKAYVQKTMDDTLNGNNTSSANGVQLCDTETDEDTDSSDNELYNELIAKVASSVINPILNELGEEDVSIKFTSFSMLKVLMGGEDTFKDEITKIVKSLADGIISVAENLLKDGKIINTIVEESLPIVIDQSIEYLTSEESDLPAEAKEILKNMPEEEKTKLKEDLKALNTPCKDSEEFVEKVGEIAPTLMKTFTGEEPDEQQIEDLKAELNDQINSQLENLTEEERAALTDNFKLETFICLTLSDSVSDLFNFSTEENAKAPTKTSAGIVLTADGEEENGGSNESENQDEKPKKVYTSFGQMFEDLQSEEGIDINGQIEASVNDAMSSISNELSTVSKFYGLAFIFFAAFMLLWLILFLFSFFHMFAKNKRFVMWYVKLFCWIPGLIWLALMLARIPAIFKIVADNVGNDLPAGLIKAVTSGISSWGTGISFICYCVLWLVSIFWAFPIKHKIRKLKKQPDQYNDEYSYSDSNDDGDGNYSDKDYDYNDANYDDGLGDDYTDYDSGSSYDDYSYDDTSYDDGTY